MLLAQRGELAMQLQQVRVPGVGVPAERLAAMLEVDALGADLVAGEDHRDTGERHEQADGDDEPLPSDDCGQPRGVV